MDEGGSERVSVLSRFGDRVRGSGYLGIAVEFGDRGFVDDVGVSE
jgi:hypothetical protein